MDSVYKQQLCRKLDSITALERSGYGIVRKPVQSIDWIAWAGGFLIVLGMFAIAIGFNLWLDSGCGLTGVITTGGKVCIN